MMKKYLKNAQGFTLIELIITVAVAGIMLSIGVPSFNGTIRNSRLTTNTNELIIALHLARGEAIKRNKSVTIKHKSTQWDAGWDVFLDNNKDGNQDTGDELIKTYSSLPTGFTLRANKHFITFTSQGFVKGESSTTFELCGEDRDTETAKMIKVNAIGRPTFQKGVNSCPS